VLSLLSFYAKRSNLKTGLWLALGLGADPIRRSGDGVNFVSVVLPIPTRMTRANGAYLAGTEWRVLGSGPSSATVYFSNDTATSFVREASSSDLLSSTAKGL
jgi:hypothetical protein